MKKDLWQIIMKTVMEVESSKARKLMANMMEAYPELISNGWVDCAHHMNADLFFVTSLKDGKVWGTHVVYCPQRTTPPVAFFMYHEHLESVKTALESVETLYMQKGSWHKDLEGEDDD